VLSLAIVVIAVTLGLPLAVLAGFMVYVLFRYTPIIGRIFEEKPVFSPLRAEPEASGETVTFQAADGVALTGTYFPARTSQRVGVMVFCHEYLSDRWSFHPYCDCLRDLGFDLFTFDFRNHGDSGAEPRYTPLQWVTDHEMGDLRAALEYLRSRPDRDPAGVGLFGISRGGSTALCVAAKDAGVWGVITDGAFPTRGTMWAYMHRWAEIYVGTHKIFQRLPAWFFNWIVIMLGWSGRIRSEWRLQCRFPDVEQAAAALAPRPWLMIHGEDDAYISAAIARRFFAHAREPKRLWMVAGAKHNRCREVDPEMYTAQVADFVRRYAPRHPLPPREEPGDESNSSDEHNADFAPGRTKAAREVASSVAISRRAPVPR
jgi:uncharacterized protein